MSNITIGNETRVGKNDVKYTVTLDGKLVGAIRRTWDASGHGQYQYTPKGSKKGGEFFLSLASCVRSLRDDAPEYKLRKLDPATIVCGPITWRRDDTNDRGGETWDASLTGNREDDRKLHLTCFHVKNYGPKRAHDRSDKHGFVAWQVGSGGPFEWMAAHTAPVTDAIRAATPWLVDYWREQAAEKMAEANELVRRLSDVLDQTEVKS